MEIEGGCSVQLNFNSRANHYKNVNGLQHDYNKTSKQMFLSFFKPDGQKGSASGWVMKQTNDFPTSFTQKQQLFYKVVQHLHKAR